MGQEKKALQGLAAAQGIPHAGVILGSEVNGRKDWVFALFGWCGVVWLVN